MERKDFEKEIGQFDRLINECRKKASEVLMKLQGETEFILGDRDLYTFIDHGEGRFETAFLKDGEPFFTIRLYNGTTRDIDFIEATWDFVLLCDVMDKFFDLDGDEGLDGTTDEDEGDEYEDDDDHDMKAARALGLCKPYNPAEEE